MVLYKKFVNALSMLKDHKGEKLSFFFFFFLNSVKQMSLDGKMFLLGGILHFLCLRVLFFINVLFII